jgi:hypothetical protein
MIYFCVNTYLIQPTKSFSNYEYDSGITKLIQLIHRFNIVNYKIIIIDCCNISGTFLEKFGCDVLHTENSLMFASSTSIIELRTF